MVYINIAGENSRTGGWDGRGETQVPEDGGPDQERDWGPGYWGQGFPPKPPDHIQQFCFLQKCIDVMKRSVKEKGIQNRIMEKVTIV